MHEIGVLVVINKMLDTLEPDLKIQLINSLDKILKIGKTEGYHNLLSEYFESLGGDKKIEMLQYDSNTEISKLASSLFHEFFNTGDNINI